MSYKATVIVSIYNNIEALKILLDSLKLQTEQSFEIIISEDAEHTSVAEFCASYDFVHDYQHLTQPDVGWQKNLALNRAIRAAKSDYLIFVDGDCILHPRFVEQHLRLAEPKGIVAGKRVKLGVKLSDLLLEDVNNYKVVEGKLRKMLFFPPLSDDSKFIEEGVYVDPDSMLGRIIGSKRVMRDIKGCNMSFSKSAIYDINGFDEDYILPAIGEDTDLTWRFKGMGYHLVSSRNFAVQYHLYHKENWSDFSVNSQKMKAKQDAKSYVCSNGLVKK